MVQIMNETITRLPLINVGMLMAVRLVMQTCWCLCLFSLQIDSLIAQSTD